MTTLAFLCYINKTNISHFRDSTGVQREKSFNLKGRTQKAGDANCILMGSVVASFRSV